TLDKAIKRAYDAGLIMVAAAGNEDGEGHGYFIDETPMYPVCHDGENENRVIGVAATDPLDQKASFSSYGFRCIDLSAPGVSIFTTSVYEPNRELNGVFFDRKYDGYWSGTSMAVPIVSGVAALVETANPELSRDEIRAVLLDTADNINRLNPQYLGRLGIGRVNAYRAVERAWRLLHNRDYHILVAPASNRVGEVKRFTYKGNEKKDLLQAYADNFRGGVNVAAGDIDGDGQDEIITGAGPGGGPHIRIFNNHAQAEGQFFSFFPAFRGGVNVAVGDIQGGRHNTKKEIIVAPVSNMPPQIRIFDNHGKTLSQFYAYSRRFNGGVNISIADVDYDGKGEIITGAGPGGGPHVRTFEYNGRLIGSFYAYEKEFSGGVNIATIKINK
ncbi:hypothetical protein D6821_01095, partial [Candidatus Parcubacteria bacterium]